MPEYHSPEAFMEAEYPGYLEYYAIQWGTCSGEGTEGWEYQVWAYGDPDEEHEQVALVCDPEEGWREYVSGEIGKGWEW